MSVLVACVTKDRGDGEAVSGVEGEVKGAGSSPFYDLDLETGSLLLSAAQGGSDSPRVGEVGWENGLSGRLFRTGNTARAIFGK